MSFSRKRGRGRGEKDKSLKKGVSLPDITNHLAQPPGKSLKISRSERKLIKKGGSYIDTGYTAQQLAEQKLIKEIESIDTTTIKTDGIDFKKFSVDDFYQLIYDSGQIDSDNFSTYSRLSLSAQNALGKKYEAFQKRGRKEQTLKKEVEEAKEAAKKADPDKDLRLEGKKIEELCRKCDEFFSAIKLIGSVKDNWAGMLTEEEQVKLAIFLAPYQGLADEVQKQPNPFPLFSPSDENGLGLKKDEIVIKDSAKAKIYFAKLKKQISAVFESHHLDRYMPFYNLIVSNFPAFERFLNSLEHKYNKLDPPSDKNLDKKDNPLLWLLNKYLAFRQALPLMFQFAPRLRLLVEEVSKEAGGEAKSFVDRLEGDRKKSPVPLSRFMTLDLVTQSPVVKQYPKEYDAIHSKEVKLYAILEAIKERLGKITEQLKQESDSKWNILIEKVNQAILGIKENTILEPVIDVEIILNDFERIEGKKKAASGKKEYKEEIKQLKALFEQYKEMRGDIVLSPFPGYEYIGGKEGGANRPGEFGGRYKSTTLVKPGEKPEIALIKKEEDVAKVMGEGAAGVMLNAIYKSIGVDLGRVAQVSFIKAYPGSKETREDQTGERVYLKSTYISGYQDDLWKKAFKDKYEKKIHADSEPSSLPSVMRSRSEAMSRTRSKVMPAHRPSQVFFKTTTVSRYLAGKKEMDFVRQFAELAGPRLLIGDFGIHDANFGVAKDLVALDFGAAYNGLDDTVDPYSRFATGIAKFYKNHFLDYSDDIIKSDKMAMVFIQLGHVPPTAIKLAIAATVKQFNDYFTIESIKEFCARLRMPEKFYKKLTDKAEVLKNIEDYMNQQMPKRQQSLKEQGYMLLLEHCIDSKKHFSPEVLKNKLLQMNGLQPGLGDVTRAELVQFVESDNFSKILLQLRDRTFKRNVKENLDAIKKLVIGRPILADAKPPTLAPPPPPPPSSATTSSPKLSPTPDISDPLPQARAELLTKAELAKSEIEKMISKLEIQIKQSKDLMITPDKIEEYSEPFLDISDFLKKSDVDQSLLDRLSQFRSAEDPFLFSDYLSLQRDLLNLVKEKLSGNYVNDYSSASLKDIERHDNSLGELRTNLSYLEISSVHFDYAIDDESTRTSHVLSENPSDFFYHAPVFQGPAFLAAFNEAIDKLDSVAERLGAILAVLKTPAMMTYLKEREGEMAEKRTPPGFSKER